MAMGPVLEMHQQNYSDLSECDITYKILNMHMGPYLMNHANVGLSCHSQYIHRQGKENPQRNIQSSAPAMIYICNM